MGEDAEGDEGCGAGDLHVGLDQMEWIDMMFKKVRRYETKLTGRRSTWVSGNGGIRMKGKKEKGKEGMSSIMHQASLTSHARNKE